MHPMQDLFLESFHKYYKLICTPICTKKFILVKSGCYKLRRDYHGFYRGFAKNSVGL
jgi:hypothetical protein